MTLSSSDRRKQILYKLIEGGAYKRDLFSEVFSVSEKTIQRDIEVIRDWRWPVESGNDGYYLRAASSAEKKEYPDMFLAINLLTNSVVDQKIPPLQPELNRQLKRNYLKIDELDAPSADKLESALDLGTNQLNESILEIIGKLSKAILATQTISFTYKPLMQDKGVERQVFPVQLRERDSCWYLCAYDLSSRAMRVFALTRISDVEYWASAEPLPSEDEIQQVLENDNFGIWMSDSPQDLIEVKVKFLGYAARLIQERKYHSSQVLEIITTDEVIASFTVTEMLGIKLWLRSFISESIVLSPTSLREEIIAEIEHARELYQ